MLANIFLRFVCTSLVLLSTSALKDLDASGTMCLPVTMVISTNASNNSYYSWPALYGSDLESLKVTSAASFLYVNVTISCAAVGGTTWVPSVTASMLSVASNTSWSGNRSASVLRIIEGRCSLEGGLVVVQAQFRLGQLLLTPSGTLSAVLYEMSQVQALCITFSASSVAQFSAAKTHILRIGWLRGWLVMTGVATGMSSFNISTDGGSFSACKNACNQSNGTVLAIRSYVDEQQAIRLSSVAGLGLSWIGLQPVLTNSTSGDVLCWTTTPGFSTSTCTNSSLLNNSYLAFNTSMCVQPFCAPLRNISNDTSYFAMNGASGDWVGLEASDTAPGCLCNTWSTTGSVIPATLLHVFTSSADLGFTLSATISVSSSRSSTTTVSRSHTVHGSSSRSRSKWSTGSLSRTGRHTPTASDRETHDTHAPSSTAWMTVTRSLFTRLSLTQTITQAVTVMTMSMSSSLQDPFVYVVDGSIVSVSDLFAPPPPPGPVLSYVTIRTQIHGSDFNPSKIVTVNTAMIANMSASESCIASVTSSFQSSMSSSSSQTSASGFADVIGIPAPLVVSQYVILNLKYFITSRYFGILAIPSNVDVFSPLIDDDVTFVVTILPACLHRQDLHDFQFNFTISKLPGPVSDLQQGAMLLAFAASLYSPMIAMHAQRSLAAAEIRFCQVSRASLPRYESPVMWSLGVRSLTQYHAGAAVTNSFIVAGVIVLCGVCAFLTAMLRGTHFVDSLTIFRFPSVLMVVFAPLLQPTVTQSIITVLYGDSSSQIYGSLCIAFCAVIMAAVFVGMEKWYYAFVQRSWDHSQHQLRDSPSAATVADRVRWLLLSDAKWRDLNPGFSDAASQRKKTNDEFSDSRGSDAIDEPMITEVGDAKKGKYRRTGYCKRNRWLIAESNERGKHLIIAELTMCATIGVLRGFNFGYQQCGHLSIILTLVMAAYLLSILLFRPFLTPFVLAFTVVMSTLQIIIAVSAYTGDMSIVNTLEGVCLVIVLIRCVVDLFVFLYRAWRYIYKFWWHNTPESEENDFMMDEVLGLLNVDMSATRAKSLDELLSALYDVLKLRGDVAEDQLHSMYLYHVELLLPSCEVEGERKLTDLLTSVSKHVGRVELLDQCIQRLQEHAAARDRSQSQALRPRTTQNVALEALMMPVVDDDNAHIHATSFAQEEDEELMTLHESESGVSDSSKLRRLPPPVAHAAADLVITRANESIDLI